MNGEIIERLYRRHYKYFFIVAYNICGKWDVAEDVVQDGFIRILLSKETFLDVAHGRRYLTGCVKNAAFDRLKLDRRGKAIRREFLHELPPSLKESLLAQVGAYLSKMKCSTGRKIMEELYFHDRSRQEVGKMYEVSRQYVRSHEKKILFELAKLIIH